MILDTVSPLILLDEIVTKQSGKYVHFVSHLDEKLWVPKPWNSTIFTSAHIANLLALKMQPIPRQCIEVLQKDTQYNIPLSDGTSVLVTMFESNEMRGNVMFCFKTKARQTTIYSGPVIQLKCFLTNMSLKKYINKGVDTLYVDNTRIKSIQTETIDTAATKISDILKKNPGYRIMLCTPSFGYEDLVYKLATEKAHKVFVGCRSCCYPKNKVNVFTGSGEDSEIIVGQGRLTEAILKRRVEEKKLTVRFSKSAENENLFNNFGADFIDWTPHPSLTDLYTLVDFIHPLEIRPIYEHMEPIPICLKSLCAKERKTQTKSTSRQMPNGLGDENPTLGKYKEADSTVFDNNKLDNAKETMETRQKVAFGNGEAPKTPEKSNPSRLDDDVSSLCIDEDDLEYLPSITSDEDISPKEVDRPPLTQPNTRREIEPHSVPQFCSQPEEPRNRSIRKRKDRSLLLPRRVPKKRCQRKVSPSQLENVCRNSGELSPPRDTIEEYLAKMEGHTISSEKETNNGLQDEAEIKDTRSYDDKAISSSPGNRSDILIVSSGNTSRSTLDDAKETTQKVALGNEEDPKTPEKSNPRRLIPISPSRTSRLDDDVSSLCIDEEDLQYLSSITSDEDISPKEVDRPPLTHSNTRREIEPHSVPQFCSQPEEPRNRSIRKRKDRSLLLPRRVPKKRCQRKVSLSQLENFCRNSGELSPPRDSIEKYLANMEGHTITSEKETNNGLQDEAEIKDTRSYDDKAISSSPGNRSDILIISSGNTSRSKLDDAKETTQKVALGNGEDPETPEKSNPGRLIPISPSRTSRLDDDVSSLCLDEDDLEYLSSITSDEDISPKEVDGPPLTQPNTRREIEPTSVPQFCSQPVEPRNRSIRKRKNRSLLLPRRVPIKRSQRKVSLSQLENFCRKSGELSPPRDTIKEYLAKMEGHTISSEKETNNGLQDEAEIKDISSSPGNTSDILIISSGNTPRSSKESNHLSDASDTSANDAGLLKLFDDLSSLPGTEDITDDLLSITSGDSDPSNEEFQSVTLKENIAEKVLSSPSKKCDNISDDSSATVDLTKLDETPPPSEIIDILDDSISISSDQSETSNRKITEKRKPDNTPAINPNIFDLAHKYKTGIFSKRPTVQYLEDSDSDDSI